MKKEKRRFTRIDFPSPALLTVGDAVYSINQISNLSVGGALVPCELEHEKGAECFLQIPIAGTTDNLRIEVRGKIMWSEDQESAIQFTSIDPDSLFHLQNIIKYNAENPEQIIKECTKRPGIR